MKIQANNGQMGMYFNLFSEKAEIETDLCYVLPYPDRHTFLWNVDKQPTGPIYPQASSFFQNIPEDRPFVLGSRCQSGLKNLRFYKYRRFFVVGLETPFGHLGSDRTNLLNFRMIGSKTGCDSALKRLFHPQNRRCKSLQIIIRHNVSNSGPTMVSAKMINYFHDSGFCRT